MSAKDKTARTTPEEARRDRKTILWLVGSVEGKAFAKPLPGRGPLRIGRSRTCDIRIEHQAVSAEHALLQLHTQPTLTDLQSTNGTWLAGTRLSPRVPQQIHVGQLVELVRGRVLFTLLRAEGAVRPVTEQSHAAGDPLANEPHSATYWNQIDPVLRVVAASNASVLIRGETGVGKEVLAERLHRFSRRADKPFLCVNCAALPESLAESELFGHERGAFTGAFASSPGLLASADGGTVFLDEVGEMSGPMQARLLRVLESNTIIAVGSTKPRKINLRFLAATHRTLEQEVSVGRFRADLLHRIDCFSFVIPPLRNRRSEIPMLAGHFLDSVCQADEIHPRPSLSPEAMKRLSEHEWPGNVRELRNVITRAVILCHSRKAATILPSDIVLGSSVASAFPVSGEAMQASRESAAVGQSAASAKRDHARRILQSHHGNRSQTAKALRISRTTLAKWLQEPSQDGASEEA